MFSKHGVPSHVTSDRGPKFVSTFFRSLASMLQMKLHFTSGHHLEGDGQSKRTNQTLEQYLHSYCNYQQDNWSKLLPLAKFAFNNSPSASTGVLPFFTNKGYHPWLQIQSLTVMNHPFAPKIKLLFFFFFFSFLFFSFLLLAWESMSHNVTGGVTSVTSNGHITGHITGHI